MVHKNPNGDVLNDEFMAAVVFFTLLMISKMQTVNHIKMMIFYYFDESMKNKNFLFTGPNKFLSTS